MTRRVSMTCPDIGYSMPRKKFDSGKIRVLILNVYAACLEPDTSPYFRFSQEYGFVSTNIGTMTQLISHSANSWSNLTLKRNANTLVKVDTQIEDNCRRTISYLQGYILAQSFSNQKHTANTVGNTRRTTLC